MSDSRNQTDSLGRLKRLDREIHLLEHVAGLLQWDQETCMPPAGIDERADQLALLEGEVHARRTTAEMGDLIGAAESRSDLTELDRALVRELRRGYDRATRLPGDLVRAMARQSSVNHATWVEARTKSDFSIFRADLEHTLKLTREKADCLGFEDTRYDPLLDEFEPWMTTAELRGVLDALRAPLVDLLQRITGSGVRLDDSVLHRDYDVAAQRAFSDYLLEALGFSAQTGRLDVSAHPFSTTLGAADGRLTTRFYPNLLSASIFGTIHECGHGLHGLGVAPELATTELGDGTSLGICESQSRFWENLIARRRAFWEHFYPELQPRFPALADVGLDQFHQAVNAVQPSLIRVEADEVTYNLHILLRFGLERRLVDGEIEVADLPEAWREESRELLGIVPEQDADGVLQDIHWSMFLVGYFPTYSLGNLYSAQFHAAMARDIGDWEEQVRRGEFAHILGWLRDRIHRHGRVYSATDICRQVTGEPLNARYFLDYLEGKFGELYRL
ncbi:MAG: carboxypeptidase M32 [Spirochaetaceae bacterium]|nr:carboxypeptidase M32 [Spirochaetaceae bacterium]